MRARWAPERWLANTLTGPQSPSASLYVADACADWIAEQRIRQLSPTVFAGPGATLVVRHDGGLKEPLPPGRLIYLIDDHWQAAGSDPAVPLAFRLKYRLVEQRAAAFYLPRAAHVVVSGPALVPLAEAAAPGASVHVLGPYWADPPASLDHHDRSDPVTIAYLGAQVHRADLAFLVPVLRQSLADHPTATVVLSAQHRLPPDLGAHPRVARIAATSWDGYRTWLRGARAHLALYPLIDTPFNRARSQSKLGEHAVIGAATLASQSWAAGADAAAAGRAAVVGDDPVAWVDAIAGLLRARGDLRAIAAANARAVRAAKDRAAQRELYRDLMGL